MFVTGATIRTSFSEKDSGSSQKQAQGTKNPMKADLIKEDGKVFEVTHHIAYGPVIQTD